MHTLLVIELFEACSPVVLVESPLYVAFLRTAGFPALASFGANVSHTQLQLLADRASRIVLAMDNDPAGRKAHHKLVKAPEFTGKELFTFNYGVDPDAKDVGDMSDSKIREGLKRAKRIRR